MKLKGSCHCNQIQFELDSHTPVPFIRCYCCICRKIGSGAPFSNHIMGVKSSLKITRQDVLISTYQAVINREAPKEEYQLYGSIRSFCSNCSSNLWAYYKEYGDLVYPFASAIDTPLPKPQKVVHMMMSSKAEWVSDVKTTDKDTLFDEFPDFSVEDWHKSNGYWAK